MLRVQIGVLFTVLVLVLTGAAYWSHQSTLDQTLERDAALALERAATIAEHERRVAEYSLILKAQFVASGQDLHDAITTTYNDRDGNPLDDEKQNHERHLKVHERLNRYLKEFELYDKNFGKDVDNNDLPLLWRRPVQNDLYFAVDQNGIGLAALGKDLLKWYGDDVSKLYPIISEVMVKNEPRTAVWRWSFESKASDADKALYTVALAPIRLKANDRPVGVVIIGNLLNDGVAKNVQSLIAGSDKADAVAAELAPHIAFFQGDSIVSSTLDTRNQGLVASKLLKEQKILEQEGRQKKGALEIDGEPHMAKARYLLGHAQDNPPVGVIVLSNLQHFKKPLKGPGRNTIFVGFMVLLLGLVGIMVFIQIFLKPLDDIEAGIQEIIAGNKDYAFQGKGHKVAQSMAHQLNLLSAFLQGKPMPDDEDGGGGSWAALGANPGAAQSAAQGASKAAAPRVQGVSMADLMKPPPRKDDDAGQS